VSERFPARRSRGGDLAAPVAGLLLFAALAILVLGASRDPSALMLVLCSISAVLAAAGTALMLWAIAYQRLSYALTDSSLRIEWLGRTVVVPYPAIQGIYTGQRLSGHATASVPRWPGINVGPARVRGLGRLRFFATSTDQSQLTFVTVEHGGVIISARDPNAFRAALIDYVERYEQSAVAPGPLSWQQRGPTRVPWTAFADVWLPVSIAVGTVAVLLVLASIGLRYDALPDQLVLHFDAGGQATQIGPKSDLMRLPFLGTVVLVVNWVLGVLVHEREQVLARLLWVGGAVVQFVLLIGVLRLVA